MSSKVALVTGASRGLGAAIARQLAEAGATLALVARDTAALEEVAGGIRQATPAAKVHAYHCDIGNPVHVEATYAAIVRDCGGGVDVLVNNAAIQGQLGKFETLDWHAWRAVFEVDLFAAARLCQLVIPGMRAKGWGKIVNVSGGGATGPRPDVTAYACAKTALVRLSETLAEELKGSGVDVNTVAPGAMNTRMLEETLAAGPTGASREYESAVERAKKGGTPPEKAAELVTFLASPVSDGISGRLISAVWDDWRNLPSQHEALAKSDVYTLRRIVPKDRGWAE